MRNKQPPFEITNDMILLVAEIAELVGRVATNRLDRNPTLRRVNRIRTIHGSLAIEQNTLTLEQVTAVLNGKQVIAPPRDVAEVKNAYSIYERLDSLNPSSVEDLLMAHGIMMGGLVEEAGCFRSGSVGVVDTQGRIVHFGTLPAYVPELTMQLLEWVETSPVHPLIKSCVFHYEFEFIHPFRDGNGRIGRLWHTLLLSRWNPLFAWLPVESMIHNRQEEYYGAINRSNAEAESTAFILFMLDTIKAALMEAIQAENAQDSVQVDVQDSVQDKILLYCRVPRSLSEITAYCGYKSTRNVAARYLKPLLDEGKLKRTIPDKPNSKNQRYVTAD